MKIFKRLKCFLNIHEPIADFTEDENNYYTFYKCNICGKKIEKVNNLDRNLTLNKKHFKLNRNIFGFLGQYVNEK
jgi:hypothetical protein